MGVVFGVRWNDNLKRVPLGLMALVLAAASFASTPGAAERLSVEAGEFVSVIVREQPGTTDAPERYIESTGGTVEEELAIINGYVARVPRSAVATLSEIPGVHSVTANGRVKLLSHDSGVTGTGSLNYIANVATGAIDYYRSGILGKGVDVALIDSGISPVAGLDSSDKVVHGPDLSFESQSPDHRYLDTFGHGTHMAGIIAGLDSSFRLGESFFAGVAPKARLVSVKVADAEGATDVSQIIAAIDWVVQHRNDNGMNIRVLNLSFGTDGTQDYRIDPLTYAAEVAWRKGIVVVVAGGNRGYGSDKLNNPAYDPFVIAVGASDPKGTWRTSDDEVANFSSRGDGGRNPDLVAPGKSIISLRVPGSAVDVAYPKGRVGDRFLKGSGTSQAAAVVSGAAALVLQQRPNLTPDQVKALLTKSATKLPEAESKGQGAGLLDLRAARTMATPIAPQAHEPARGTGSLDAARGSTRLIDNDELCDDSDSDGMCVEEDDDCDSSGSGNPCDDDDDDDVLDGERDIFGAPWDANRWSAASLAGVTWTGGIWNANRWSGDYWNANRWSGVTWTANRWSGKSWASNRWSSNRWSSNRWSGGTWSSNRWSSDDWSSNRWSSNRWSSAGYGD